MRKEYKNTIQVMSQGDEGLAKVIKAFVDSFPKSLNDKLEAHKKRGITTTEEKRWVFEEHGNELSVSLGKNNSTSSKDYMNMFVVGISDEQLKHWPKYEGEKMIGFVTIYLYNENNKREKPLQLSYDFYVRRVEKKLVMSISTNFNAAYKENAERLEAYGLSDIHNNIINSYYVIDTEKILQNNNR